ncbi:MAG: TonB-dependent receptor [Chitinophagaceae bacterium]
MKLVSLSLRRIRPVKSLTAFLLLLAFPALLFAQSKTVTGTVLDETGNPVASVSVSVKGSAAGTATDANGKFSVSAATGAVLVISSVNFETTEVTVGKESIVAVNLKSKAGSLNDVVVVGYATQKKANLTGSVSSISAADLDSRPVTNVSSALAGLSSGVFVRQGSGRPGADGATIRIRGVGTLNNSDPLVVIDGIIGSMDAVNPDDIQSMSVLKDAASASIYGSQAANGVILITTKKGSKNKNTVSYNGFLSSTAPGNRIDFVDNYARHMGLINESSTNLGQTIYFPQARIEEWKTAAANPNGLNAIGVPNWLAYPNTNWSDWIFKNKTAQNHNLSVSGGNEKVTYLLSGNYQKNPGVVDQTTTERYQFRANIEAKINKVITVGTQTFASLQTFGLANLDNVYTYLSQTTPGLYPYYDGKYGYPTATEENQLANNIQSYLDGTGGRDEQTRINSTLYTVLNLYKGLSFEGKVNYQTRFGERNTHALPINKWDFNTNILRVAATTPDLVSTGYSFNKDYRITLDGVLRYNTKIGSDHEIGALAGYNEFYFNYYDFNASKLGLIDYSISTLGSAGGTANNAGGTQYDRSVRSWFGRINYAYKSKYLLEGNLRYDGSSRFAKENRWGYYPSVSAGWRISEENFFANMKDKIRNLKLRASWGKLGNIGQTSGGGNTIDYPYQAFYSAVNYSYNGIAAAGLRQGTISNADLQWEITTQTNIGLEATIFRSLNIELDYYNRLTNGIITNPPIPLVLGTATPPFQNTASIYNRGVELSLGWSKKVGQLDIGLSGNFAYNTSKVSSYKGKLVEGFTTDANGIKVYSTNLGAVSNNGNPSLIVEDHMAYEFYVQSVYKGNGSYTNTDGSVNINGGPSTGMIRTAEDLNWVKAMIAAGYKFAPVATAGTSTSKTQLYYGDLIYADNNSDGTYGSAATDRKFTGTSTTPKYNFGFSANLAWKGIDFSMLWAGSTGMQYYWNDSYNTNVTRNGFGVTNAIANDHYYFNDANTTDPLNNINAKFPRLKYNSDAQNSIASDFWLYNASYVKLKNLQIGYTIPGRYASKALITRARVYLSGENLLTITNYPGMDPEVGASIQYPTLKQFAAGISLTF